MEEKQQEQQEQQAQQEQQEQQAQQESLSNIEKKAERRWVITDWVMRISMMAVLVMTVINVIEGDLLYALCNVGWLVVGTMYYAEQGAMHAAARVIGYLHGKCEIQQKIIDNYEKMEKTYKELTENQKKLIEDYKNEREARELLLAEYKKTVDSLRSNS